MRKFITSQYQRLKAIYARYERILMPATLIVGFLADYITFTTIKIEITFIVLFIYWLAAGLTIAFIHFYDAQKLPLKFRYVRLFAPLLIQFTFGALLGSSLIFYWFSGVFSISWPLIFIIAILMIFNEVFRHYFLKPAIQISIYFFITISLFSILLPFVFHSLSAWLFVSAGMASLVIFYVYIRLLSGAGENMRRQRYRLLAAVFCIFAAMNLLYFTNIIPPIPLSLREAGLYHSIKVSNGSYTMLDEAENFWQWLVPGQTLNVQPNGKVYFYTAIFAPPKLDTSILHDWQYYDNEKKQWVSKDKLSFIITGGRREGYKGYSFNYNLAPGAWRIYVENERGQVLGRIRFDIKTVKEKPVLQETIR